MIKRCGALPQRAVSVREPSDSRVVDGRVRHMAKPAMALVSGRIDSTTVLVIAQAQGFDPFALSFRYGERHEVEIAAARRVAEICDESLATSCATSTSASSAAPRSPLTSEVRRRDSTPTRSLTEIPITYVPARNTMFLSFALAYAEVVGATDIFIGVNALDYTGYPDCRPEYIAAYEHMANLATRAGVTGTNCRSTSR